MKDESMMKVMIYDISHYRTYLTLKFNIMFFKTDSRTARFYIGPHRRIIF